MDKRLPPLLVAVFVNIAGFSLILPLLPFYGQVFGAGRRRWAISARRSASASP